MDWDKQTLDAYVLFWKLFGILVLDVVIYSFIYLSSVCHKLMHILKSVIFCFIPEYWWLPEWSCPVHQCRVLLMCWGNVSVSGNRLACAVVHTVPLGKNVLAQSRFLVSHVYRSPWWFRDGGRSMDPGAHEQKQEQWKGADEREGDVLRC